jgi:hypothetical protein
MLSHSLPSKQRYHNILILSFTSQPPSVALDCETQLSPQSQLTSPQLPAPYATPNTASRSIPPPPPPWLLSTNMFSHKTDTIKFYSIMHPPSYPLCHTHKPRSHISHSPLTTSCRTPICTDYSDTSTTIIKPRSTTQLQTTHQHTCLQFSHLSCLP